MIVNLTQHNPTPEQVAAGVGEPLAEALPLLNFSDLPTSAQVREVAEKLANLALNAAGGDGGEVMLGGAPFLMAPLEEALRARGLRPVYAFSRRESVEEMLHDGSVKKTQIFRHVGFVEAP